MLEADSGSFYAYQKIGSVIGISLNRHAEAIPYLEKAVALNPKYDISFVTWAKVLYKMHRDDDAISTLREGLTRNSDSGLIHSTLGELLTRLGRYHEAVTACEKAIELNSKDQHAYFFLGFALEELGDNTRAISCYEQAVDAAKTESMRNMARKHLLDLQAVVGRRLRGKTTTRQFSNNLSE